MLAHKHLGSAGRPPITFGARRLLTTLAIAFLLCLSGRMNGQEELELAKSPEAMSISPLAAQRGSVFDARIRGKSLEGVYGVWFAGESVSARIERVEPLDLGAKCAGSGVHCDPASVKQSPIGRDVSGNGQVVLLRIKVDDTAKLGKHFLRLVTPHGLSNALELVVGAQPIVLEADKDNNQAAQAQEIQIPSVIAGRVEEMGDRDFYSFNATAGQELYFHAVSNSPLNNKDSAQLTLYREAGSWFDSERPRHLAFSQDSRLSYKFGEPGRYFVAYTSFQGIGGSDVHYRLCVGRPHAQHLSRDEEKITPPSVIDKLQDPLQRKLGSNRLQDLQERTILEKVRDFDQSLPKSSSTTGEIAVGKRSPGRDAFRVPMTYGVLTEEEPNETEDQALETTLPVLVEGVIQRPGDVDTFKLKIPAKASLAFEIETPEDTTPTFNPHVSIIDANGEEILNNYFRKIAGDGDDWVRMIRNKVIYTFEREGIYTFQIRDITARYGGPTFRYRVLVRPQIPHIGRIDVQNDAMNLVPGKAHKLTIVTNQEEGFSGEVMFRIEGLPNGVEALAGADVESGTGFDFPKVNKERFEPKNKKTTILMVTAADAPATQIPVVAHIIAWPIVEGELGTPLEVESIPVMVLSPSNRPGAGSD